MDSTIHNRGGWCLGGLYIVRKLVGQTERGLVKRRALLLNNLFLPREDGRVSKLYLHDCVPVFLRGQNVVKLSQLLPLYLFLFYKVVETLQLTVLSIGNTAIKHISDSTFR